MMAVVGILFTDALGLPKFWLAGAEVSLYQRRTSDHLTDTPQQTSHNEVIKLHRKDPLMMPGPCV